MSLRSKFLDKCRITFCLLCVVLYSMNLSVSTGIKSMHFPQDLYCTTSIYLVYVVYYIFKYETTTFTITAPDEELYPFHNIE